MIWNEKVERCKQTCNEYCECENQYLVAARNFATGVLFYTFLECIFSAKSAESSKKLPNRFEIVLKGDFPWERRFSLTISLNRYYFVL